MDLDTTNAEPTSSVLGHRGPAITSRDLPDAVEAADAAQAAVERARHGLAGGGSREHLVRLTPPTAPTSLSQPALPSPPEPLPPLRPLTAAVDSLLPAAALLLVLRLRGSPLTADTLLLLAQTFLLLFPARAPFTDFSCQVQLELWLQTIKVMVSAVFFMLFLAARALLTHQPLHIDTGLLGQWVLLVPVALFALHGATAGVRSWQAGGRPLARSLAVGTAILLIGSSDPATSQRDATVQGSVAREPARAAQAAPMVATQPSR